MYEKPLIDIEDVVGTNDEYDVEVNIEAGGTAVSQGVADEGENIPRIVEQLGDEDRELDDAMNEGCDDDSSDDDDVVPEDWVSSDFSHLVINQGDSVPWDCMVNKVVQGVRYESLDEVKEVVKCWSLSLMREFRTVSCKRDKYE